MIKTFATAVVVSMALVAGAAQAAEFTATPLNSGPPKAPGIPVVDQILGAGNAVTSPILQPVLAPGGGAAPMMAEPMMHHRHHHRMMHKHMMMKKHMMKKAM